MIKFSQYQSKQLQVFIEKTNSFFIYNFLYLLKHSTNNSKAICTILQQYTIKPLKNYYCLFRSKLVTIQNIIQYNKQIKICLMLKQRNVQGRRSARSNKQTKSARSSTEKLKKKKDQVHSKQKNRNLSLSFYNQQTLIGSKKIMLDLFPIQCVQTQHYVIPENLQPCNFGKWQKKNETKDNQKRYPQSQNNKNQVQKPQKSHKMLNPVANSKNCASSVSMSAQRKYRSNNPFDNERKSRKQKQSNNKQKSVNQKKYLQKYLDGYLKKIISK